MYAAGVTRGQACLKVMRHKVAICYCAPGGGGLGWTHGKVNTLAWSRARGAHEQTRTEERYVCRVPHRVLEKCLAHVAIMATRCREGGSAGGGRSLMSSRCSVVSVRHCLCADVARGLVGLGGRVCACVKSESGVKMSARWYSKYGKDPVPPYAVNSHRRSIP
jgi:hypothetical protein